MADDDQHQRQQERRNQSHQRQPRKKSSTVRESRSSNGSSSSGDSKTSTTRKRKNVYSQSIPPPPLSLLPLTRNQHQQPESSSMPLSNDTNNKKYDEEKRNNKENEEVKSPISPLSPPSKKNDNNQAAAKPLSSSTTSTWSWFPSIFTSIFMAPTPNNDDPEKTIKAAQPSPPPAKKQDIKEKRKKSKSREPLFPAVSQQQQKQHRGDEEDGEKISIVDFDDESPPRTSEKGLKRKAIGEQRQLQQIPDRRDMAAVSKETQKSSTLISVDLDEDQTSGKELKPQTAEIKQQQQDPSTTITKLNLKECFELDPSSNKAISTEPAVQPKANFNRISFSRTQTIYMLPNAKQRVHKKIVRSRHDAWRRYGALVIIHQIGGWTYTMNGKAKHFQKIEKGTPLPHPPTMPPIMTEEEFHLRPIITVPNTHRDTKSKRQRNRSSSNNEKKESKGDTDTSVSDDDPPSC